MRLELKSKSERDVDEIVARAHPFRLEKINFIYVLRHTLQMSRISLRLFFSQISLVVVSQEAQRTAGNLSKNLKFHPVIRLLSQLTAIRF